MTALNSLGTDDAGLVHIRGSNGGAEEGSLKAEFQAAPPGAL